MDFKNFFSAMYPDRTPYPYQQVLAEAERWPSLLGIATGLGKTAAVLGGWCYRRFFHPSVEVQRATPRRLVYVLPMRVLCEQTLEEARRWCNCVRTLAEYATENRQAETLKAYLLMGGEQSGDWDRWPEREAILIGTQDMLLSRALNRGYAMSRYRWPVHFALLNNDCLWVLDEIQLMGVGLTTSAQLEGLRRKLSVYGVAQSLWMSATLDSDRLSTVDYPRPRDDWDRLELAEEDRALGSVKKLIEAVKPCGRADSVLRPDSSKNGYTADLAAEIVGAHRPGTLTLAVINRVDRAQKVFQAIQKLAEKEDSSVDAVLIHSRFRPIERGPTQARALDEKRISDAGRIIVATQAIEAGVDISATTLFTELAPWSSMVQRFGRCNRRGLCGAEGRPEAQVVWIDIDTSDAKKSKELVLPYSADGLDAAREHISALSNVGPASLEGVVHEERPPIVHTIRRKDLLELWDTTPDLAGNDLDVSRYIRDADDTDVQVYWRVWDKKERRGRPPDPRDEAGQLVFPAPAREELCAVSVVRARDFVKRFKADSAWRWNPLERVWQQVRSNEVRPGMVLLLHVDVGGYDATLGWTGKSKYIPDPVEPKQRAEPEAHDKEELGEKPVILTRHLCYVTQAARDLAKTFRRALDGIPWEAVVTAALWHDVGKVHPAFQNAMRDFGPINDQDPDGTQVWAKSGAKGIPDYRVDAGSPPKRRGFRHELASALAWLDLCDDEPDADLIAFLIAAHHGKVRGSIRSLPIENVPADPEIKFARGVWDKDVIPAIELESGQATREVTVDLSLMELGEDERGRPSWLARVLKLRGEYGPFRLAFLEMLVRIADWRGSEKGDSSDVS